MRKPLSLSIGVVAVAAGFAVASIVAGGSLGAVKGVWRQLTGTTRTLTTFTNTTYTSTTGGRGIEVCRRFGRGHRHFSVRYVSQQSLQANERGGYRIGPCLLPRPPFVPGRPGGRGWNIVQPQVGTQGSSSSSSGFVGKPSGPVSAGDDNDGGHRGHDR
jgi:hypothetical protein